MSIPDISMISDFEAGVKCLQNPTLISRFVPISGITKVPQVYSFCKWGALFLAIVATFSSIITRIKLFFIYITSSKPSCQPILQPFNDSDIEFTDDEDDCSSSEDEEEEEDDDETEPSTSFRYQHLFDQDFHVAGSAFSSNKQGQTRNLRPRRSNEGFAWPEFTAGKNVVKLWDSLALGSHFEDCFDKSVVSLWGFDEDQDLRRSIRRRAAFTPSTSVILTAEENEKGNGVVLGVFDRRTGRHAPSICAEWKTAAGSRLVGFRAGGVEKVYVRNDVSGAPVVGDMRNFKQPLNDVTETDSDIWWDADAVIIDDEDEDASR